MKRSINFRGRHGKYLTPGNVLDLMRRYNVPMMPCSGCLASGWCEGSPGWVCKDCNGTGQVPITAAPEPAPSREEER